MSNTMSMENGPVVSLSQGGKATREAALEKFEQLRKLGPGQTVLAQESAEPEDELAQAFEGKGYTADQARRMAGLEPAAEAAETADELDADTRAMVEYYLDRGYTREAAERMAR